MEFSRVLFRSDEARRATACPPSPRWKRGSGEAEGARGLSQTDSSAAPPPSAPPHSSPDSSDADTAALAKGGRTNFFGFVLRLVARLPFLYIAGRWYGPEAVGRFAFAVLVIELVAQLRSEEHTSELQSLMRISYAVFCLKKKKKVQ